MFTRSKAESWRTQCLNKWALKASANSFHFQVLCLAQKCCLCIVNFFGSNKTSGRGHVEFATIDRKGFSCRLLGSHLSTLRPGQVMDELAMNTSFAHWNFFRTQASLSGKHWKMFKKNSIILDIMRLLTNMLTELKLAFLKEILFRLEIRIQWLITDQNWTFTKVKF